MRLPKLIDARLVRRYKRFLADVTLPDGSVITVHCPNTGAMTGCAPEGARVWLSQSDNPKRKYPHTWELVETAQGIVSVNTGRANALVSEVLHAGDAGISPFGRLDEIRSEVKIPDDRGRFDFCLQQGDATIWVEVKSATLLLAASQAESSVGAFPDAVSTRAQKHVRELAAQVATGDRAALVFCAQHTAIEQVQLAWDIDPTYAQAVNAAADQGVEVYALGCSTDLHNFELDRQLAVSLEKPLSAPGTPAPS